MKKFLLIQLMLGICLVVEAQSGTKSCPSCNGTGHVFGHSEMVCPRCNGNKKVPLSPGEIQRQEREMQKYVNNANEVMEQFNLSPQEFFAFEELVKEAMKQVPIYQSCTACGGTGNCKQCGGYMNVSLDGPLCRICGGSGQCVGCSGLGQILLGYQENPNKMQLIQRANEILHSHETQPTPSPLYDDEISEDASSSSSNKSNSTPTLLIIIGVVACAAAFVKFSGFRFK